ncbi:zn2 cys6 dna-binding protein [Stemphylium lycopersici]|nr:zn2 cys6 dna-binding protein [Stemphylium lycopersici]
MRDADITLRQLERSLKLRVKTGCQTCRKRRVKCDETKPACTKCAKAGRTCGGYNDLSRLNRSSPAAAATYRNSSFLVIPQQSQQPTVSRSPFTSLSPEPQENRSFQYFQTHTLPRWTEFFDSELWTQTVLQMSHFEPAIKHGVLALSMMHERLESSRDGGGPSMPNDAALIQYMRAVRHSNTLLNIREQSQNTIEKILIACIIFTCFENLAGNYKAANMHLRNGLRILNQHGENIGQSPSEVQKAIRSVLVRFDLQAMTYSDDTSPYQWGLDRAPEIPDIPEEEEGYKSNEAARDDLVKLSRCMLWSAGNLDGRSYIAKEKGFKSLYESLMRGLREWDDRFTSFVRTGGKHKDDRGGKEHRGKTLLQIYAIIMRTIAAAEAGLTSEMAWDAYIEDFREVVDLAETLPMLQQQQQTISLSSSTPSPPSQQANTSAPSPTPTSPSETLRIIFRSDAEYPAPTTTILDSNFTATRTPLTFSPSFELSPIVPLFLIATRCRDPLVRRRALALLLNYRRREGVWDSFAAGMVAASCIKQEEGILHEEIGERNWIPLSLDIRTAAGVPEPRRLGDLFVGVRIGEGGKGVIEMRYDSRNGEKLKERRRELGRREQAVGMGGIGC